MLAVGDDEALNAMIATDLSEYFGRGRVFQLAVTHGQAADFYTSVPVLFEDSATHDEPLARINAGGVIVVAQAAAANGERTPALASARMGSQCSSSLPGRTCTSSPPATGRHSSQGKSSSC